jgi:hypothetical protein
MVKKKGKRQLIILGSIAFAILIIIGLVALFFSLTPGGDDPYKQEPQKSQTDRQPEVTNEPEEPTVPESTEDEDNADESSIDPANVSTIDIQPLSLTVSYNKDIGAFQYSVQRTASGTQYVEFMSPELAGTKCTDDEGAFVSILESPDTNESSTINKTKTVDGTTYGLSLADDTCTKDPTLLKKYQAAFSDAFSLLKKLN